MRSRSKAASVLPRETLSSSRPEICPGRFLSGMTIVSHFLHLTLAPIVFVLLASCSDLGSDPSPPEASGRQYPIAWPSLANSPWPMNHADPQSTGRSKYRGPSQGMLAWQYDTVYAETGVVMADDSVITRQVNPTHGATATPDPVALHRLAVAPH